MRVANRLRQALTLAIVVLAVAVPTPATAQVDSSQSSGDAPTIGSMVTVEKTSGSSTTGAGPSIIDSSVEFPSCCNGPSDDIIYDIDIADDRITMTWAGDDSFAGVTTAGTAEDYTFTFADANFKRAFADQSQLLAPTVTWTTDSITVSITEGDEVGPGRTIVIIVTPFAPNADGITATESTPVDNAADGVDDESNTADAADDDESEATELPRTGTIETLWLTVIAIALLGTGLVCSGTALRSSAPC